jgi:hypothetical protein
LTISPSHPDGVGEPIPSVHAYSALNALDPESYSIFKERREHPAVSTTETFGDSDLFRVGHPRGMVRSFHCFKQRHDRARV